MRLSPLFAACLLSANGVQAATICDSSFTGTKLIVLDATASSSTAKAVFVATGSPPFSVLAPTSVGLEATLDVAFDGSHGLFAMPPGSGWFVAANGTSAKYKNDAAPTGGSVKVGKLRFPQRVKVVARSLGDEPIDVSLAPTGSVYAALTVTTSAFTSRHCTQFAGCVRAPIANGTGSKLICRGGGSGDHACRAIPCRSDDDDCPPGCTIANDLDCASCLVDLGLSVQDTCTGLEWEKKDTAVGSGVDATNLHDVDNGYAWFGRCSVGGAACQPTAAAAAACVAQTGDASCDECGAGEGVCTLAESPGAITTVWDWVSQVNLATFGGHSDWRLPTVSTIYPDPGDVPELESIVDRSSGLCEGASGACIAPAFGPTSPEGYWGASVTPFNRTYVEFTSGCSGAVQGVQVQHVRAVRSSSPSGAFLD